MTHTGSVAPKFSNFGLGDIGKILLDEVFPNKEISKIQDWGSGAGIAGLYAAYLHQQDNPVMPWPRVTLVDQDPSWFTAEIIDGKHTVGSVLWDIKQQFGKTEEPTIEMIVSDFPDYKGNSADLILSRSMTHYFDLEDYQRLVCRAYESLTFGGFYLEAGQAFPSRAAMETYDKFNSFFIENAEVHGNMRYSRLSETLTGVHEEVFERNNTQVAGRFSLVMNSEDFADRVGMDHAALSGAEKLTDQELAATGGIIKKLESDRPYEMYEVSIPYDVRLSWKPSAHLNQ